MTMVRYKNFSPQLMEAGASGVRLVGLAAAIEDVLHGLWPSGAYEIEMCRAAPEAGFDGPYLLLSRSDRATMAVKFASPRLGTRTDVVVGDLFDCEIGERRSGRRVLSLGSRLRVEDLPATNEGAAPGQGGQKPKPPPDGAAASAVAS